jgi:acyl-CoA synthetase (AMP-forming)/AMP-acid ligase II
MERREDAVNTWSQMIAGRDPDARAVVDHNGAWTVAELHRRAAGAADWLDAEGFEPGRPAPGLLGTTKDAVALLLAGAATERPLSPLGPRLTAPEIASCLTGLGADRLVTAPAYRQAAEGVAALVGCEVVELPSVPASDRPLPTPDADATAFILHTSGTSGVPKAAWARQDRMAARARVNSGLLELGPTSVYTTASPFHHIAGLGMLAVALASESAVASFPEFSIDAWRELSGLGVTHALVVPTMLEMLLAAGALDIGTLRLLAYGGAPMHPDTLRRTLAELPDVRFLQIYGQTEGSPICFLGPEAHQQAAAGRVELLRSVGRPAPGVTLEVQEPDEAREGEIRARAAHFFRTAEDGWLHTGDLGRIDEDGYVYLLGRRGDMIIRGGENVHPVEVEQVLAQHPRIREVAVLGIPDRRLGQTVHAVVVPADRAAPPSEDELRAHVRAQLSGFKTPSSWSFVDALPRNQQGKLLRRVLVEQFPGA